MINIPTYIFYIMIVYSIIITVIRVSEIISYIKINHPKKYKIVMDTSIKVFMTNSQLMHFAFLTNGYLASLSKLGFRYCKYTEAETQTEVISIGANND